MNPQVEPTTGVSAERYNPWFYRGNALLKAKKIETPNIPPAILRRPVVTETEKLNVTQKPKEQKEYPTKEIPFPIEVASIALFTFFIVFCMVTMVILCFALNEVILYIGMFFFNLNLRQAEAVGDAHVQVGPDRLFPAELFEWGPHYVVGVGLVIATISVSCTICCCILRKMC